MLGSKSGPHLECCFAVQQCALGLFFDSGYGKVSSQHILLLPDRYGFSVVD
jgi:hypothetical protein